MSKTTDAILHEAIAHYGPMAQKAKAIEELSELIRALARDDRENVAEEMADVWIMLRQLEMLYENRDRVREIEWMKLVRLKERITNE